jgi:ribose transport system ATP-binding protein
MPWSNSFARQLVDASLKRTGQGPTPINTSPDCAGTSSARAWLQGSVILRLENVTKTFPGVCALSNVRLEIRRGEVHAVCGENGAGKSTLVKIISGIYQPDSGTIIYKGKPKRFLSPREAEAAGISIIHQELNLVPHLSAAENIFLAREPKRGLFIVRARLKGRDSYYGWADILTYGIRGADIIQGHP